MNIASNIWQVISSLFGLLALAIGVVNTFWGNDAGFGIFVILLSLVFFSPVNTFIQEKTGRSIPVVAKVLLGLFILWAALGVGELFAKLDLMQANF